MGFQSNLTAIGILVFGVNNNVETANIMIVQLKTNYLCEKIKNNYNKIHEYVFNVILIQIFSIGFLIKQLATFLKITLFRFIFEFDGSVLNSLVQQVFTDFLFQGRLLYSV